MDTIRISLWISVSLLIICSGCALTLPASESLIFKQQQQEEESDNVYKRNWAYTEIDGPISAVQITFRPKVNAELGYAKDKFADFIHERSKQDSAFTEDDLRIRNPYNLSIAASKLIVSTKNIQWAVTMGFFVLGTDITARLFPETFITANVGYLEGELILQQKVLEKDNIELALGAFYRVEQRGFEIEGTGPVGLGAILGVAFDPFFADKIFYNKIAGLRFNGFWSIGNDSYLHFMVAPGYAFNLNVPVLDMGLGIQLYF